MTRGTGATAYRTEYLLDGFQRLTAWHDIERNDRRDITYDEVGRRVQEDYMKGGLVADTHFFDVVGRLTEVLHPDSTSILYTFGRSAFPASATTTIFDEEDHDTVLPYEIYGSPDDGRLAQVRDADNKLWKYEYHADYDLLTKIDPPSGANREFVYNARRLLEREKHPETVDIIYRYNRAGDRDEREAASEIVTFGYDHAGRLTSLDPPGSPPERSATTAQGLGSPRVLPRAPTSSPTTKHNASRSDSPFCRATPERSRLATTISTR